MIKRVVDLAVISDLHLGTAECRAEELLAYLKSIQPRVLILNGDIIDIWAFRKTFWPESHTRVVRRILKFAANGVPVYYVTGNHDEALRRFSAFALGQIHLVDRLELDLPTADGGTERTLIIHGDQLDGAVATPPWLRHLGCFAYDRVVGASNLLNRVRRLLGLGRVSLAATVKDMAGAAAHIAHFEEACARHAASQGFDAIVTGHIHSAHVRIVISAERPIRYANSGDWVESLSALERTGGCWRVVRYADLIADGLMPSVHVDTAAVAPAA